MQVLVRVYSSKFIATNLTVPILDSLDTFTHCNSSPTGCQNQKHPPGNDKFAVKEREEADGKPVSRNRQEFKIVLKR